MKWALAASQFGLLATLLYRGVWRAIPSFASFLVFAVISSLSYNPDNPTLFKLMSVPSILLRSIVCIECVWILTSGSLLYTRALMVWGGLIGSLIMLSISWGLSQCYGLVITFIVYCALGIAGALWTVIGILSLKAALAKDWRRGYVLGVATYFAVLAFARISGPSLEMYSMPDGELKRMLLGSGFGAAELVRWAFVQDFSMLAYVLIFCWLAKHFFDIRCRPWPEELDEKDDNRHGYPEEQMG